MEDHADIQMNGPVLVIAARTAVALTAGAIFGIAVLKTVEKANDVRYRHQLKKRIKNQMNETK